MTNKHIDKNSIIQQYYENKENNSTPKVLLKQSRIKKIRNITTIIINTTFISIYTVILALVFSIIGGIINVKELLKALGYNFANPEESNSGILQALKYSGDTVLSEELPMLYESRYEIIINYLLIPTIIIIIIHIILLMIKRYFFNRIVEQ